MGSSMQPQKLLLDTDIGDDVDDALALGLICASPEVELVAVTTVFGNVLARARQARTILKIAGEQFAHIPVAAGCGASLASRPLHNITAYLENHLPNQDPTCLPEAELPPIDPRHGVDLIIDTIQSGDGEIIPITIGAMTNFAVALTKERRIAAKIPKIIAMASEVESDMVEWNIRCDPEAAHIVLSSGIPVDIIPLQIGTTVSFTRQDVVRLAQTNRPLARCLCAAIAAWAKHPSSVKKQGLPHLYDPMTIATLIKPELVTWKRGTMNVELGGQQTYGQTTFQPSGDGKHRVAFDAKRDDAIEFYLDRITRF
jgi:inosine-uridine nucleoside N-ribohydrolase